MADNTSIEWADSTWNPVTGCVEVSPGCDHCYAKTFAERWRGTPGHHFENGFDLTLRPERLDQPLRWKKPRRIFVNSMSDLFHKDVPDEFIADVFAVMAVARQHTFQVLTKRHGRMRSLLAPGSGFIGPVSDRIKARGGAGFTWPLPNVWLGVSVEDQHWADIRVPALLATDAAVRFLSCEPLLGPVSFRWAKWVGGTRGHSHLDGLDGIHWVIVGGESGHGARAMHPQWARDIRDQCAEAEVPFLFKQWGEYVPDASGTERAVDTEGHEYPSPMRRAGKKAAGRMLDGRTWDEFPTTPTGEHVPGHVEPASSSRRAGAPGSEREAPTVSPVGPATTTEGAQP